MSTASQPRGALTWWAKLLISLAVGGVALALDRWVSGEGASVLTAVIAAATVAYCWFTYDLVTAANTEREDRTAAAAERDRLLLERVLVELRQNLHRKGQTHAWYAHVPFEMSAFNEARHLFSTMPAEVWTHVAEISSRSARYNTVADYHNSRVTPGSGMGDGAAIQLAGEAHDTQANAIPILERWIREQHGAHSIAVTET